MRIRIRNGTFGYREKLPDGSYSVSVLAKTPQDPPFEVDTETGKWLIINGIAEAADCAGDPDVATALPGAEAEAEGSDPADAENAPAGKGAPEGGPDGLDGMSFQELKALAEELGLGTKSLRSKAALAAAIRAADEEAEDDGEELPALDAGDRIV